jgi:hypothetical protein
MSILPVGLWLFYNLQEAGSLTDRVLGVHPVGFQDLSQGVNILTSWIFPGVPPNASLTILSVGIGLTGLVILIFYLIRSLRSQRSQAIREAPEPPAIPFAIYTLTYLVFVPLSISFFDAQTSLDWRILSPIYVTCLILVSVALARWAPRLPKPARWAGLIAILVVASAQVYSGIEMARLLTTGENKGYNSDFWKTSKLIQQVDGYPASTPIYSNGYDVIYLLTGRAATSIPKEFSPNSLRANPRFEEEMQAMQMELAESNGLLVVFFEMEERRRYLPSEYELNELLPLERITRWTEEGTLYRVIHQPDE